MMIDYIHNGPSPRTFEMYLNSFLKDDSDIAVCIREIKTADQLEMIKNSTHIKDINIEYDVIDDDYSSMFKGEYEEKAIMTQTAKVNGEFSKRYDSKIANLILRKGKFKDPLNMEHSLALLYHLDTESSIIRSIKVRVKKGFTTETYDLKHNKKLYKIIDIKSSTYVEIKNNILNQFNENFYKDSKLELNKEYKNITNRVDKTFGKEVWDKHFLEIN